jgi:hypothetical protein
VVEVDRDLGSPSGGPTRVSIYAVADPTDSKNPIGSYDSLGIMARDLRAIPMLEAAALLEEHYGRIRVTELLADLPETFDDDLAYARLAEVLAVLQEWNVRNPLAAIAHNSTVAHNTWNGRLKRAKQKGLVLDIDGKFVLSPRSTELLRVLRGRS